MLTRTFLFLLAMMSGLSAAQAAERMRPMQSEMGAASSNAVEIAAVSLCEDIKDYIKSHSSDFVIFRVSIAKRYGASIYDAPLPAPVFIGDRNRQ